MITSIPPIRISDSVEEKLREVRSARDRMKLAEAVALGLFVLLAAMLTAMLIDWSFTLFDTFWRIVLTVSALSAALATFAVAALIGLRRNRQLAQVAAEVDRAVPRTEERWSTMAELAAAPLDQQRRIHRGLLNRLSQETDQSEPVVHTNEIVTRHGLRRTLAALAAAAVLLMLAVLIDWHQTWVLVQRFWAPTADISATRLDVSSINHIVARGEPLVLQATMQGRPAGSATLFLKLGGDREEQQFVLEPTGEPRTEFVHRIKAAEESLTFRLRAGDGQTAWESVRVVDRPQIAGVRFQVTPPAYTGLPKQSFNELPEKASMIEGSMLELSILPLEAVEHVVVTQNEDRTDQLSSADGRWYRLQAQPAEDQTLAVVLIGEQGLENKHPPRCRIHVVADKKPTVEILSPTEDMAARPDDDIDITFTAGDDFGISRAELVIYDAPPAGEVPHERQVIDIPLEDQQGAAKVYGSVPLDLKPLGLANGQVLSFAVRVYDTRQATAMSSLPMARREPPSPSGNETTSADASELADAGLSDQSMQESHGSDADHPEVSNAATSHDAETRAVDAAKSSTSDERAKLGDPSARTSSKSASPPGSPADAESSADAAKTSSTTPPSSDSAESTTVSTAPGASNNDQPLSNSSPDGSDANNSSPPPAPPNGNPPDSSSETGAPRPPDEMTTRMLDVAQSASSGLMNLHIDKWSGSFSGQQRQKLEMLLAPRLEELDQILEQAENREREALDHLEADEPWTGTHDRLLTAADEQIDRALALIEDVQNKSAGTVYAFVGLQLAEIAGTHLTPAGDALWKGRQAKDNATRSSQVEIGWQQTMRARRRLAQLTSQFARIRREHHLADAVENVKTMYQAFVEDSFALLTKDKDNINNYQRRMAQFELDEEYLKRLEEVLKNRQKLIAEFARILASDPRLLRRFVANINSQSETLRDQLTLLTLGQQELAAQVRAWEALDETQRPSALVGIVGRQMQRAVDLSESAAQLQEAFDNWVPLDLGVNDAELESVRQQLTTLAAAAQQMENLTAAWNAATDVDETPDDQNAADKQAKADDVPAAVDRESLTEVVAQGHVVHEQLLGVDARLLELSARSDQPELGPFVVRRLAETRRLIAGVSGWVYQLEQLEAGDYHIAASVDQHQIARETNELTASLADLEQQLVGVLQREDGKLPAEIAELSRKLLATLDERVAGSQLGAVFLLKRNDLATAVVRTHGAAEGLVEAERLFDELIKAAIDEADKLPVQDPIADLLDDPTLDELLALLENERDLAAALGIPLRPSNLRVMGDFLRPGGGGGGGRGGMVSTQMNSGQRMLRRAERRARSRANAEGEKLIPQSPRQVDRWNVLASELENRLLQGQGQLPPERYRRAIEQYFSEIARDMQEEDSP